MCLAQHNCTKLTAAAAQAQLLCSLSGIQQHTAAVAAPISNGGINDGAYRAIQQQHRHNSFRSLDDAVTLLPAVIYAAFLPEAPRLAPPNEGPREAHLHVQVCFNLRLLTSRGSQQQALSAAGKSSLIYTEQQLAKVKALRLHQARQALRSRYVL
jgi:hypothetical protein